MTLTGAISLFLTMVFTAAIPGMGVLTVSSRALASGFTHGLATVVGIVTGDYIFIILSVYGLSAIAQEMSLLFNLIKALGAGYLIWLGIDLIRLKPVSVSVKGVRELSWLSNYLAGLLATVGNPKAMLFYVSIFPLFIDMSQTRLADIILVMIIATLAVGGVMSSYAYFASQSRKLFQTRLGKSINMTAGCLMIGAGTLLAIRIYQP